MRNLNYVNFTINCYIKNCVVQERGWLGHGKDPKRAFMAEGNMPFTLSVSAHTHWKAHMAGS